MIDVEANPDPRAEQSPGWWMKRLAEELYKRRKGARWRTGSVNPVDVRPGLDLLHDYYRNEPPLPTFSANWGPVTAEFLRLARMNYAALVVGAVADRLMPKAWRTSQDSDRDGDQIAMQIADANQLEIKIGDVVTNALEFGTSYTLLGAPRRGSNIPTITAEDPREFISAHDAATDEMLASLKVFRDDWGDYEYAYLCRPGRRWVARRKASAVGFSPVRFSGHYWEWDEGRGGSAGEPIPNLPDHVAAARFRCRDGIGEFERHLPALDRINDGIFDRLSTGKHQAHRQRGLKNAPTHYPEDHPLAGEEIEYNPDSFSADPGALWRLPPGVEVWESQVTDLTPIRAAIRDDVEGLAAATFTPLYYINPDSANGSAEGSVTMREGHIFRVEDRARRMAAGLADTLSLAFRAMGDNARADGPIKTIWAPFERFSLRDRMEAANLAKQAGLTQASVYTDVMGYPPAELKRLEAERAEDDLFAPAVPVPPQTASVPRPPQGEQTDQRQQDPAKLPPDEL